MMGNRRAYIAAFLALIYPGLGHLYLRTWIRAIAWVGLAIGTVALIVPPETLEAMGSGDLGTMLAASRTLPLEIAATILLVRLLNVVDAFLVATRPDLVGIEDVPESEAGETRCPACGKELDDDLDFCPWCTQRLDGDGDDEGGAPEGERSTAFR